MITDTFPPVCFGQASSNIEQIINMPVPQIMKKIVLVVSLTSTKADRRANVDVPVPQVAGGVFTPDGLYESSQD